MEYTTLSNGVKMPMLGFGIYQIDANETERCVLDAIKAGYRSIDTAQVYFNEEGIGEAVKKSGVAREELFITSKVWLEHYGYDACRSSVLASLSKLKLDYVDLMLLYPSEGAYFLRTR
ncbi:aldo/keto reductase, partial [Porphyromonas endodontalis]|uniref:aldo/keto reductase n=1 Tax=Porphyromonas endodontalis TaxID=28124 RepID=UPI003C76C567